MNDTKDIKDVKDLKALKNARIKKSLLTAVLLTALGTVAASAAPCEDASRIAAAMAAGQGGETAAAHEAANGLAASQSAEALQKDYELRPGDQLNIVVTQQQDLGNSSTNQVPFVVRPDGNVSFPLAGEIHAEGMTVSEFTAAIRDRLARYIVEPDVAVNIIQLGRMRVYLFGEVKKPGAVELEKSHSIIDAIGAAEGFTRDAAKKKVYLIHQDQPQSLIPINLNHMLTTGDLRENYTLREGDILYLTRNHRIDFARDIAPIFNSIYMITETKDNLD